MLPATWRIKSESLKSDPDISNAFTAVFLSSSDIWDNFKITSCDTPQYSDVFIPCSKPGRYCKQAIIASSERMKSRSSENKALHCASVTIPVSITSCADRSDGAFDNTSRIFCCC